MAEPVAVYHLNVSGSATRSHNHSERGYALLERHLQLSAEQGCREDFEIVARFLVRSWCRVAVFYGVADEVGVLTERYGWLLRGRFRLAVRLLMVWPEATRWCCRGISRLVRFFNLRRRIIRRPT